MLSKPKIIIVEDNYLLRLINKKGLEQLGYNVVATVGSGIEAIEACKLYVPEIIIMDIRLEGEMDGVDTMKEIMKFSNAPAIYLTGNSDQFYRDKASETRMIAFCVKPVHFEEIKMHIENFLKDKSI